MDAAAIDLLHAALTARTESSHGLHAPRCGYRLVGYWRHAFRSVRSGPDWSAHDRVARSLIMKIAYVLRRSRKAAFLRGLVVAVLLGLLPLITNPAEAAIFTVQDGLIKLASPNYEVAFSAADGSISYILDKATGQNISDGNNENTLWLASPDH